MALYGDVVEVERLTPHMVRVVLGGAGLADFTPTPFTDQYVNALFVPPGAPYGVPFDPDEAGAAGPEHRPRGAATPSGPGIRSPAGSRSTSSSTATSASPAAGRATPPPVTASRSSGRAGGYAPDPDADWHLMVGDESALPAIAASLEQVPAGPQGAGRAGRRRRRRATSIDLDLPRRRSTSPGCTARAAARQPRPAPPGGRGAPLPRRACPGLRPRRGRRGPGRAPATCSPTAASRRTGPRSRPTGGAATPTSAGARSSAAWLAESAQDA